MYCKLNHNVIYLKILANILILGSFKKFKLDSSLYSKCMSFPALPTKQGYLFFTHELTKSVWFVLLSVNFLLQQFSFVDLKMWCCFSAVCSLVLFTTVLFTKILLDYYFAHGTVIRKGITCKKISCYMRDSGCNWFILKKIKYFEVMLNIFEFLLV